MPIHSSSSGALQTSTLAGLPNATNIRTGTAFSVTDYGGNIATVVAGAWRFEYPFRTTWSGRPAAGLVHVGTELQVTDFANQKWINDGTYWRPAQGRVIIGNSVTPSVVTGAADMMFTLPTDFKKIPSGMLIPGSRLMCYAEFIKSGANGALTPYIRIGTSDSYSDTVVYGVGIPNTNNMLVRASGNVLIGNDGLFDYSTSAVVSPGNGTQFMRSSANFDINADMFMSVHIRSANAADSFTLMSTSIILEA